MQMEVRLKVLGLSASLLQSCSSAGSRDQVCTINRSYLLHFGICLRSCSYHMLFIQGGSRMLDWETSGLAGWLNDLRPIEC